MFRLIKILNSAQNVPEPQRMRLGSAVTLKSGIPLLLQNGTVAPVTGDTASLPTHVALADCTDATEVVLYPISPDMVFEVPVEGTVSALKTGNEYLVGNDSLSLTATAASGGKRGAVLVDKTMAEENGLVLVSFPRA